VLLLLIVAVFGYAAVRVWQVGRQDSRRGADAIVVLGAAQFDGQPSRIFAARLAHALQLYQDDVADHIVTLGGSRPGDRFTEAQAGARWLTARGVPAGDIEVVGEGSDTLSSMRAAATSFAAHGWRSAVLVTDPWHSLRSRSIAHDLGINAQTSPSRTGPAVRGRGTEFRYIMREATAYLAYRLFGRSGGSPLNAA
jgi:uncharacterized SAM-binding protein YcdF (DUF218 family)